MKVTLIDYTGAGLPTAARYAASMLIYTKSTRLQMTPSLRQEIANWDDAAITKELTYMANTIPSSWEFVDYTFQIEGVTRAFTHQFVRTRTASFAQQTMRVLEMDNWEYLTGPSIEKDAISEAYYDDEMTRINDTYRNLISNGAKIEDARGILPTNILTNITVKMNMRTFIELLHKRESSRTQGEYRDVLAAMKAEALKAHSWLSIFIDQSASKAVNDLEEKLLALCDDRKIETPELQSMVKLLDQIRRAL